MFHYLNLIFGITSTSSCQDFFIDKISLTQKTLFGIFTSLRKSNALSIQIAGNGSEKDTNDEWVGIPFARGLSFYTMCFFLTQSKFKDYSGPKCKSGKEFLSFNKEGPDYEV